MGKRTIVYARVSTTRQADHDLSIPDQLAHAERYCREHDLTIVGTYVDAGASARNDNRPEFQRMTGDIKSGLVKAEVMLVHALSRYFRDSFGSAFYVREFAKYGVSVVSMTQETGEGAQGEFIRQMIASFDEYQSAETAKHVTRSMLENAKRGYWNGSTPPFGYKTITVERHGNKEKKKLAIEPKEAELVKLIFQLYLLGDGKTGPLGIKNTASYLNARGLMDRNGTPFRLQQLHQILRRTAYIGIHHFNCTDSRNKKSRPRHEWIELPVPSIVDENVFHAAQAQLDARNPKMTAPRITNSRILLTGIAHCEDCGAPMRTRTGKGGQYWYYTCSRAKYMGKVGCGGVTVSMPKLDEIVTDALCEKVLQPDRLQEMLGALIARNSGRREQLQAELRELQRQRRDIDQKLDKLADAVENGAAASSLYDRFQKRQNEREQIVRLISFKTREIDTPLSAVTPEKLDAFAASFRARLRNSDDPAFRRAYMRLLLHKVIVGKDAIQISGPKAALAHQLSTEKPLAPSMVPTFMDGWCTRQESNL
tara:strand:- start:17 stop:1630 length:1614 start_codon:yes stop_codon:yes gene_type:complete